MAIEDLTASTEKLDVASIVGTESSFNAERPIAAQVNSNDRAPSSATGEYLPTSEACRSDGPPITSQLLEQDARYLAIVVSFTKQLDDQFAAMQRAQTQGDFEALARFAHYLKGAAGTVGFDAFTEPSRTLEVAALAQVHADVDASLTALRALAAQVVLPEPQGTPRAATA